MIGLEQYLTVAATLLVVGTSIASIPESIWSFETIKRSNTQ